MDVQGNFGIEITDAEAARCIRVGDLLGVVMARLEAGKTTKPERQQWTRQQVLEEMQAGRRASAIGHQLHRV